MAEDDKKAKRRVKRRKAIEELLSTEKTYVDLMSKLVEHFVVALRGNTSILSAEDYHILFPADIHNILMLNQTFLEDLTKVIEADDFNDESSAIGDILYTFCPHFKMYQNYCNNYSKAAERLAKLRSKKSASSFVAYCDKQKQTPYFHQLNLESLIILPIQRMPRYKMLVEEIIKHTEESHPDLEQLKKALAKISEVNDVINSRMKEFDARNEVQNIENRFNGKLTNLVIPSRRFIKQGQLCKIETKDDQDYLFILFNDCLLYASQSMMGDKLSLGNLIHFNSKFKLKKTSPQINVLNIENLFEIHSTDESFMLYAASTQEMDEWFSVIQRTVDEYISLDTVKQHEQQNEYAIWSKVLYIPNDFADGCMMNGCNKNFSIINRRHHCKYCGFVVCSKCSSNQLAVRPNSMEYYNNYHHEVMVRVCDSCYKANAPQTPHTRSKTVSLKPPKGGKKKRSVSANVDLDDDLFGLLAESAAAAFEQRAAKKADEDHDDKKADPPEVKKARPPPPAHARSATALTVPTKPAPPKMSHGAHDDAKLVALQQEKRKLNEQVDELQAVNTNLTQKVATLEQQMNEQNYNHEQMVSKLQTKNDELLKDNERLQTLVNTLSSTTDESKKAEEVQNTKIKTLESHKENLQNELKQKDEEIQRLLQKQSELQQMLQIQQQENKRLMQTQQANQQLLQQKHQENERLLQQTQTQSQLPTTHPSLSPSQSVESNKETDHDSKPPPSSPALASSNSLEANKRSKSPKPPPPSRSSLKQMHQNRAPQKTPPPPSPSQSANEPVMVRSHSTEPAQRNNTKENNEKRLCRTCGKSISGRALKSNGVLYHRACHVCSECNVSLAGKRYGITQSNGKEKKLCEQCTNKANERARKEFNARHKRGASKSSLMSQMNQFRRGGTTVPKPWEASNGQSSNSNSNNEAALLKPSIAASMAAQKATPPPRNKSASSADVYGATSPKSKKSVNGSKRNSSLMAQRSCAKCKAAIFGKKGVEGPNAEMFHPNCFRCTDCDNELQTKQWREYPVQTKRGKGVLVLCPTCAKKRDEALFETHQGKLKLNI